MSNLRFSIFNLLLCIVVLLSGSAAVEASEAEIYILCYHAFLERKDPYSLTEEVLKAQLESLKAGGFNFVSMEDIKTGRIKGNRNILVTIDDGNKSTYPAFFNVMKPLGIKPLLGIYPAIIGRTSYALTWEQLKKLSDEGCHIAAHGYNHLYVSEKAWKESPAKFKREIYLPKKRLEEKLGITVDTYVYPFGVKSAKAIEELTRAGYRYAFTIIPGKTPVPHAGNFEIPRFLLTKGNVKSVTSKIISGSAKVASGKPYQKPAAVKPLTDTRQVIEKSMASVKKHSDEIKKMIVNDIVILPASIKGKKKGVTGADLIVEDKEPEYPDNIPAYGYDSSKLTENSSKGTFSTRFRSFLYSLKQTYYNLLNRFRSLIDYWIADTFSRMDDIRNSYTALKDQGGLPEASDRQR